jgi:hypothetical protein
MITGSNGLYVGREVFGGIARPQQLTIAVWVRESAKLIDETIVAALFANRFDVRKELRAKIGAVLVTTSHDGQIRRASRTKA